jgi:hypothetical protein
MIEKRVAFREWLPDLPPIVNPGLVKATNALPGAGGYMPLPSLSPTASSALDARPRGAISGLDTGATSFHLAGTATKLYRFALAGVTDVSRSAGGPYNANNSAQWHFVQVGDTVLALNPGDDIQAIDLVTGIFAQLSPDAPRARYAGFIGPQLIVAHLISDPIIGFAPDAFRSPALGDPTAWPDPTDPNSGAVAAQAALTPIEGDGGRIQAVVSGSEVGAIFQENAVNRIEYVGGDVIFQVDSVKKAKGLIVPRAAVAFERQVLYLAEDGWQVFDYTTSKPIGDQKINRTFLADLDQSNADRLSAVLHPDLPLIAIAYPGAGNTQGRPNKLLFYNYALDRWSLGEVDLELLTRVVPFGITLDDLTGNLDTDYPVSFDDAVAGFGASVFGAYDTSFVLSTFSGTSLAAIFETGDQEHNPGRLMRVNFVRPLIDGAEPTVQVSARKDRRTAETDVTFGSAYSLNRSGACPVTSGGLGRYHRYRVNVPAGWTDHAVGLDIEGAPAGSR